MTGDRVRRVVLLVLVAGVCSWLLATRVFLGIDLIRIRVVPQAEPIRIGAMRRGLEDGRARGLAPPFALIARLRNEGELPQRFSIRFQDRPVCVTELQSKRSARVDCAVRDFSPGSDGEIVVAPDGQEPWVLEYLELATHHGRSTGLLHAVLLPRDSTAFHGVTVLASVLVGIAIAGSLLVSPRRIEDQRLLVIYRATSGIVFIVLAVTAVAPYVSPFRIVLSAWTFAGCVAIPLIPRLRVIGPYRPFFFGTGWKVTCWLALAILVVALVRGGRVVGGSDEYGYLSQADLWLTGRLTIDQPFAVGSPWPAEMPWWFSPLGYRPHPTDPGVIVPTYAPGLPILLALVKLIGGHGATFGVVPICGALLVVATYALGRRIGSGIAPLAATWLVATSPLVLGHSMSMMSDVPVAAAWTGAFCFLLGRSTWHAAAAGLLAGLAVLIRPNLAPLTAVLALLYVLRMRESGRRELRSLVAFGLASAPAAIAIAIINNQLYGSPFESGYGSLANIFVPARILPNLRNYAIRLVESHTPLIVLGLAALAVPLRSLWPAVRDRSIFLVIGLFVAGLWLLYCAWVVFDSWWFGRFLIASLPFIMLGIGACADALFRRGPSWMRAAVVLALVALGFAQLRFARDHSVFDTGPSMPRYAEAAELTRQVTPQNSVVIALNHSGTVRYYGERMTIYIGNVRDRDRLDGLVAWLAERGVRTFATFEDWELVEFRQRFEGAAVLQALARPPVATIKEPGQMFVYELSPVDDRAREPPPVVTTFRLERTVVQPSRPPTLTIGHK